MSLWGPVINPYQAGGGGLVTGPGATVTNVLDSTNTTDISLALSHTVDAGSDCLVVIARSCVRASVSPAATISSITFGSENLTQRATQVNPDISGDEEVRIEIWTLEGPTSGSDTLTVNYSGSTESASWTALNYSGVHQTTPSVRPMVQTTPAGLITAIQAPARLRTACGFAATSSRPTQVLKTDPIRPPVAWWRTQTALQVPQMDGIMVLGPVTSPHPQSPATR